MALFGYDSFHLRLNTSTSVPCLSVHLLRDPLGGGGRKGDYKGTYRQGVGDYTKGQKPYSAYVKNLPARGLKDGTGGRKGTISRLRERGNGGKLGRWDPRGLNKGPAGVRGTLLRD